jgi:hypothetical protein
VRNRFPASGGGYGDTFALAVFLGGGESVGSARRNAREGGLFTIERHGLRIQIGWRTLQGGNHFDHVHVGVRREDPLSGN